MSKLHRAPGPNGRNVRWFCPGCECSHRVACKPLVQSNGCAWDWNGDTEKPTLTPSFVTDGCHCFIRDGKIEFLRDCSHALAGQTVGMVELDDPKEPL